MNATSVINTRLAAQQLLDTSCATPSEMVKWMGAMQAQDYNMAKRAVSIRLPGTTDSDVENAFNAGKILRTHVMRPTWHFVLPEDIRWMQELTGSRVKSQLRSRDSAIGLSEKMIDKGMLILTHALKGHTHCTREELAVFLENAGIKTDNFRIQHLLMHAELDALVCSGALRGKKQTYALLDERAPQAKKIDKQTSLEMLARRYFASHGPATVHDFAWWSGLATSDARKAIDAIRHDFSSAVFEGQEYYFSARFDTKTRTKKSVHFLPAFDEYLIAYRNRSMVIDNEHHRKAVSSNGIFRPIILYNGKVIGTWKKVTQKGVPVIAPAYFEKPTKAAIEAVQKFQDSKIL